LIYWWSEKQIVVPRSSTEAECRALTNTTSELVWLWWLLGDMVATQLFSTSLHCDNRSAIQIAYNDVFHEGPKHIEVDCHFIIHNLVVNDLHLVSVSSLDQAVDVFTKAHLPQHFQELISKLKMGFALPP